MLAGQISGRFWCLRPYFILNFEFECELDVSSHFELPKDVPRSHERAERDVDCEYL